MEISKILPAILTPLLTYALVGLFVSGIKKAGDKELLQNLQKDHIVIRLPKSYLWVGGVCTAVFVAFLGWMTFFPNGTETWWTFAIFGFFALLGIVIMIACQKKIEVFRKEDYFLYRPTPFKTYRVAYSDFISYQMKGTNTLVVKTRGKTVRVDGTAVNLKILLSMLKQQGVKKLP